MIGRLLAGRFEIESLLGTGGMGNVYLARHMVLQRRFAIKVISSDALSDANVARFRQEARAASRIEHPNITSVVDFGHADDNSPYLVMEYVRGPTLDQVVAQDGPLPVPRALRLMVQIADGLAAAHASGVVHRDLKSRNIVLTTEQGHADFVKILDFGLAKLLGGETTFSTVDGELLGTPQCMAPEQCLGNRIDHRCDIYAFGVLAFEVLVGRPPFSGTVVQQAMAHIGEVPPAPSEASGRSDIPPDLDKLVLRCMEKRPENRFEDAHALGQQIRSTIRQHSDPQAITRPLAGLVPAGGVLSAAPTSTDSAAEVTRRVEKNPSEETSSPTPISNPWDSHESEWTESTLEWIDQVEGDEARSKELEEVAFAIRDHGQGSPLISYLLSMKLRADDEVYRLGTDIETLKTELADTEASARERTWRLRQALTQLEHEKEIALKMRATGQQEKRKVLRDAALDNAVNEIVERLEKISNSADDRRAELQRQLSVKRQQLLECRQSVRDFEARLVEVLAEVKQEDLAQCGDRALIEQLAAVVRDHQGNAEGDQAAFADTEAAFADTDAGASDTDAGASDTDAGSNTGAPADAADTDPGPVAATTVDKKPHFGPPPSTVTAPAPLPALEAGEAFELFEATPERTLKTEPSTASPAAPQRGKWILAAGIAAVFLLGITVGIIVGRQRPSTGRSLEAATPGSAAGGIRAPDASSSPTATARSTPDARRATSAAKGATADARPRRDQRAAARQRRLTLRSDPPGAKVYSHARLLGVTPLELPLDRAKSAPLRLRLGGYHTQRLQLQPADLQWTREGDIEVAEVTARLRARPDAAASPPADSATRTTPRIRPPSAKPSASDATAKTVPD